MIVVVPPWAAATVPVSNVSDAKVPPNGSSMWVWTSMPPGMTYLPVASMVRSAVTPAAWPGREQRGDGLAVDQHVDGHGPLGPMTVPFGDERPAHDFVRSP